MTYEQILEFHGHECPGVAIGYRMTLAALQALDVSRTEDEELVAIVENDACGVDALQCLTGCTFGKGNLIFRDYGKHVYTLYSRRSGVAVRVLYHGKGVPDDLRQKKAEFARWLLTALADAILATEHVAMDDPEPAAIRKSAACVFCGESVMETRIRQCQGKPACIPCYDKRQKYGQ